MASKKTSTPEQPAPALYWTGRGAYAGETVRSDDGDETTYPAVPARHLSADEVARYGRDWLLSLGIYTETPASAPAPATTEEA